jgi:hypothetical protein
VQVSAALLLASVLQIELSLVWGDQRGWLWLIALAAAACGAGASGWHLTQTQMGPLPDATVCFLHLRCVSCSLV